MACIDEIQKLWNERPETRTWGRNRIAHALNISENTVKKALQRLRDRQMAQTVSTSENEYVPQFNKGSILKEIQKECAISYLCDKYKVSERVLRATLCDIEDEGYSITEINGNVKICKDIVPQYNTYERQWNGDKIIRFGLISDTHLCSTAQQMTHLNKFYDIAKSEGIETIYHAGDLIDGDDVYPGHKFEVFVFGADNQKQYAVNNYPKRDGIKTEFITGNHDLKFYTKFGYDIGKAIANERDDMIYHGQYFARIELTPNCILQLEHPLGKPAYAVSYKTQRKIDNMRGGDKPNILAEGHYHYSNYFMRRNVHAFCVPSFQGQTKFAKRLGLESDNGAFIIEINVNDEGYVTKITPTFYPFYVPIENDY